MPRKVQVLGAKELNRLVERLASRVLKRVRGTKSIVLIGIKTRGEFLARRMAGLLSRRMKVEVGTVDIRLYRDDLNVLQRELLIGKSDIPFDLNDKTVVLVDDVLFTGRTVRAALDQIVDLGRPAIDIWPFFWIEDTESFRYALHSVAKRFEPRKVTVLKSGSRKRMEETKHT